MWQNSETTSNNWQYLQETSLMVHLTLQYLKFTHFVNLELFIRQFITSRLIFIGAVGRRYMFRVSELFCKREKAIILWVRDRELIAISIIPKFIRHWNTLCGKASFNHYLIVRQRTACWVQCFIVVDCTLHLSGKQGFRNVFMPLIRYGLLEVIFSVYINFDTANSWSI